MIRNLKVLALVPVVVFAMSALMTSVASATTPFWFNSDGDWTALSGSQSATPDTFTTDAGTLSCTTATYSGSTNATTSTTIKVAPHYTGCTLKPLPGTATIHMNGCEYEFHTDNETGEGKRDVETTIGCPAEKDITVTVVSGAITKCTIHIEPQSLGTGITLTNEESGGVTRLKAHISFSNIKYTQTAGMGEGKCSTTTTTSNGSYTGSATISGKNTGGEATNIAVGTISLITPFWFNSDGDWTALSGAQSATPDTFTTHAGTLSCTTATYTGSTNATTSTTIKVAPHYTGCTLKPLPGTATIDMNGCEYEFHTDNETGEGKHDVETTIGCPAEKDITVTVVSGAITKCTIHIEPQSLGTGITLTNEESGGVTRLKAHISFSNIKYTQTAGMGEGKCSTTTTTSNGSYTGSATISGKNTGGEATNIAVGTISLITPFWFNSDGDWTALSGAQSATPDTFTTHAGTLSCTTATYTGSTNATTSTTIKVAPHYTGCTLKPLPGTATIDMNGCEYEFHTDNETGEGKHDVETTIGCPAEKDITVTVVSGAITKCTIHIEPQSLGTGITLTNEESGGVTRLKAHISFSNIKYTQTAGMGEGKCSTTTTTSNGSYTGSATISGKNTGGEATNIEV